jgi:4-diphosphocytidyl-2-C-methyl-D-erythritol kinase
VNDDLLAPAKLTLTLRVLGVRGDGFHDLEALTVSVDAPCDTMTIAPGEPGVRLSVSGPASEGVPNDDDNLVAHAALAVLPEDEGLEIALRKVIPSGAGLGGGSSDAAAVLRYCRDRYGLAPDIVAEAAAAVGSDIPFCVGRQPAWMRGRGEIIDPAPMPDPLHVLIVVPPFSISTPAVYRAWDDLGGPTASRTIPAPAPAAHLVAELANDLEAAAERVEPRLAPFRDALEAAAGAPALLAGSGSACWIPFVDIDAGRGAAERVEAALGLEAHLGTTLPSKPDARA